MDLNSEDMVTERLDDLSSSSNTTTPSEGEAEWNFAVAEAQAREERKADVSDGEYLPAPDGGKEVFDAAAHANDADGPRFEDDASTSEDDSAFYVNSVIKPGKPGLTSRTKADATKSLREDYEATPGHQPQELKDAEHWMRLFYAEMQKRNIDYRKQLVVARQNGIKEPSPVYYSRLNLVRRLRNKVRTCVARKKRGDTWKHESPPIGYLVASRHVLEREDEILSTLLDELSTPARFTTGHDASEASARNSSLPSAEDDSKSTDKRIEAQVSINMAIAKKCNDLTDITRSTKSSLESLESLENRFKRKIEELERRNEELERRNDEVEEGLERLTEETERAIDKLVRDGVAEAFGELSSRMDKRFAEQAKEMAARHNKQRGSIPDSESVSLKRVAKSIRAESTTQEPFFVPIDRGLDRTPAIRERTEERSRRGSLKRVSGVTAPDAANASPASSTRTKRKFGGESVEGAKAQKTTEDSSLGLWGGVFLKD